MFGPYATLPFPAHATLPFLSRTPPRPIPPHNPRMPILFAVYHRVILSPPIPPSQPPDLMLLSAPELIAHVDKLKGVANKQFAAGRHHEACARYARGRRILRLVAAETEAETELESHSQLSLALHLNGAACALQTERHAEAITLCDAALALAPESTKALYRKAVALLALAREAEAESAFAEVIKLEPRNREANEQLRTLRERRAAAAAEKPGAGPKAPADSAATLATERAAMAAMSGAELVARVAKLKATANELFGSGQHQQACAHYDLGRNALEGVTSDEVSAEERHQLEELSLALHLNGAACALRTERHAEALTLCDAALVLSPKSTKARYRRGVALRALGREAEAEAAFAEVLKVEPRNREASEQLRSLRQA